MTITQDKEKTIAEQAAKIKSQESLIIRQGKRIEEDAISLRAKEGIINTQDALINKLMAENKRIQNLLKEKETTLD